jgi:hypothetical protein
MPDQAAAPEDLAWLHAQLDGSPLLPDAQLKAHWHTVLPWLDTDTRYALAALLAWADHACR